MCGIVGFTGEPDSEKLEAMMNCIAHRGPDDDAKFEQEHFQLGMRRLAIIDLTDDIYPLPNETKDVFCVFNGEIYNYQPLREELKGLGHTFATESDTEVIIHGYEEWGTKCWSRLRGMFVIILYDAKQDQLYIVRDRLGIKPVYYAEVDGRVVFSSEIKAIVRNWDVDPAPDDISVWRFLNSRVHDDSKHTFFANIKRLMPAHFMQIEADGNFRIERYWELKTTTEFKSTKSDEDYAADFREKFIESMKLHLISDVPVGVTLSGGLDSSSVTCIARKLINEGTSMHTDQNKLMTFSALHPGETIDESEYINEVVKYAQTDPHAVVPNVDEFWNEVETWMYYQEEPTISTAPYAYYSVMREAHKFVKVLLSGQGGDELMAGYIPYFMSYIQSAQDANAVWELLRESVQGFDLYAPFIKQKFDTLISKSKQLDARSMLNIDAETMDATKERIQHKHYRNLNKRLLFDLTEGSVPNLLRYEDKNSMAHSIESRVPFLDHEFVEFVHSLPIDQKIKHGWNRYVYRNAMKGLMPEKNRLRRSKIGFVNSEWEWLQAKSAQISEIFSSEEFKSRKYWHADRVLENFQAWVKGEIRGDGLFFWRVLSTELWLRIYVDNKSAKAKNFTRTN